MHTYIKKLQSKSQDTRKQIFAVALVGCMSLVVWIWIYNLGDHFNNQTKEQANNDIKPFKLFANSMSNTYNNISASIGQISAPNKNDISAEKQINLIPVYREAQ